MPLFLVDFGAWLSQPSADFAREVSAESAENKGFRARSDYSLLPSRKRVELILGFRHAGWKSDNRHNLL